LLAYEEYRTQAVVVEGYFVPPMGRSLPRPTVLDVLGPEYAPADHADVFIDNTVLDGVRVDDKAELLCEVNLAQASDPGVCAPLRRD
jgi:hypothetical protein